MSTTLQHDADRHRFTGELDGQFGEIRYRIDGNVMTIVHTEVPKALEGRGVAGDLVEAALEHARAHGLKVEPRCAYARAYMERHPETLSLLA